MPRGRRPPSRPPGRPQLDRISGFHARYARKYTDRWAAAVLRARQLDDAELPEVAGVAAAPGPPPAHRWAERDPVAAARLTAARETIGALATAHRLPVENLLPPDALRRLAWEPPSPATRETIAAALTSSGARPWQADLTAGPLAEAFAVATEASPAVDLDLLRESVERDLPREHHLPDARRGGRLGYAGRYHAV